MKLLGFTTITAAAVAIAAPAHAAWPQPKGAFYFKIWDQFLAGSKAHQSDGTTVELPARYADHSLRYYFEVGVLDQLTVVIRGNPVGYASFGDEATLYSGMLRLGGRWSFQTEPFALSVQASYGYAPPLGDGVLGQGTIDGEPFFYTPALERHEGAAELQLGHALPWGWISGAAGLRVATAGLDPALDVRAGIGARAPFGLTGELTFGLHHPFGDVVVTDVAGIGQTRFIGWNLTLSYWFNAHFAVNAGIGGAFLVHSNAAAYPLSFGLELR